ncbi:amidohydrolase family protein [Alkalibaculum sp. M08DMB]|uniref:Amidohydrolase family protein n=1 Tax=Alkalibaculum sporogenes TaxID=2655001 RepID=A0A6A7KBT5_9FIRM|nr:dihydroorotase [Alkalibaculum sporogenes]MPW26866.1 amidohydrolase family protein [Alkalibaculum sporogenes]
MIIKNVEIVDVHGSRPGNIVIQEGVITDLDYQGDDYNEEIIEGSGYTIMPSFIDLHCHLREPGYEYKEDMESGMKAALRGGYTHVCAMANTKPVIDNIELVKKNHDKSKKLGLCDLTQICALTKNFGKEYVEFKEIMQETKVFSNDGVNVNERETMERALAYSKALDFLILSHCEPEVETVRRDLDILKEIPGNLHICHVSEHETINIIRLAKDQGIEVTCEIAPHHIFESEVDYKVNPPFGREQDRKALIRAIKEGTIDICATDHAPHSKEDKDQGAPGISNIEVAFPMYWKVFNENNLSLEKLSEMMSYKPAKMLDLNCGEIAVGKEANLVLVNTEKEYLMDINKFISKSKNNPFHGTIIKGEILMTIKRGVIKYDNR